MAAPDGIILSSMIIGTPAYHAKLADCKKMLAEGYRDALAEKNRHTSQVLPPHLLPPPFPNRRRELAFLHTATAKTLDHKQKQILKAVHQKDLNKKKKVSRTFRLLNLGRGVNFNLPLHHYSPQHTPAAPKPPFHEKEREQKTTTSTTAPKPPCHEKEKDTSTAPIGVARRPIIIRLKIKHKEASKDS